MSLRNTQRKPCIETQVRPVGFRLRPSHVAAKAPTVSENPAHAAKWYQRAAGQGHAKAPYRLGLMYAMGEGVPVDAAEALAWCSKAAEREDIEAELNLGHRHSKGDGVPADLELMRRPSRSTRMRSPASVRIMVFQSPGGFGEIAEEAASE